MWSLLNNFILSFSYALIIIESSILLQTIWFVLFFNSHFKRFRLFEKFWFVFMFYVCFVSFYVVFIFCVDIFPHLYSCLECLFCTNEINAWDSGSCVNTFFFFHCSPCTIGSIFSTTISLICVVMPYFCNHKKIIKREMIHTYNRIILNNYVNDAKSNKQYQKSTLFY